MASWRTGRPDGPLTVFGASIVIAVVVLDQIAKFVVMERLPFGEPVELLPILRLARAENTGIAFSLFSGSGFPLIALALAISAIVAGFWVRASDGGQLTAAGFALILGGAIGNLIDRLRFGSVVDFLLLHFGGWDFFVFNVADAALTLGVALLLVVYLWPVKAQDASKAQSRAGQNADMDS